MKILNNRIYFNTLFQKGVKTIDDDWGVYFITGYQGSGKTFFATFMSYLLNYEVVKTNIKTLKLPNHKMEYFTKLDNILQETEEHKIYIIDEISKKYDKNSKTDTNFYGWLQQSRKRKRIVILITQEWKEVPMWLRRPARFMFHTYRFLNLPIFITTKGDAINQTFNKDTLEWECPIIERYIYKRTKHIASMYDTFEPIQEL